MTHDKIEYVSYNYCTLFFITKFDVEWEWMFSNVTKKFKIVSRPVPLNRHDFNVNYKKYDYYIDVKMYTKTELFKEHPELI